MCKTGYFLAKSISAVLKDMKGEFTSPTFRYAKGSETMNEPIRTQWQIQCAFNGYCKRVLRNEASNAHRDVKRKILREVNFSELKAEDEQTLYAYDEYFTDDSISDEQLFFVSGKNISAKLLSDALKSLPDDKIEIILLYYFFDMNDKDISKMLKVSRSTIQYRRQGSFELLKKYLEEHYDEKR